LPAKIKNVKKSIYLILFKLGFLFIFFTFFPNSIYAKNIDSTKIKDDWYIESALRYGRIVPNSSGTKLWNINVIGADLRIGKQTFGKSEWEQWFGYPNYGLAFRYAHFSDNMLQDKIACFWFLSGSFVDSRHLSFRYQLGSGLVYFFNYYDPFKNKENVFIGSALNAHIDLNLSLDFTITKQIDLILRANFSHSSNGAIRFPNYGINPISGQLAVRYHFNERAEKIYTIDTIKTFLPKNSLYFTLAPGFKQSKKNYVYDNPDKYRVKTKYLTTTFQLGYLRQFHPKYRFGGGIDIMYSSELRNFFPPEKQNEWKYMTTAGFVSFELLYNRFVVHAALAAYISRSADFYEWYYERAGFKVFLGKNRNHSLGITLKAHAGMIDYIEWGYNFQFFNWNDKSVRILKRFKKRV